MKKILGIIAIIIVLFAIGCSDDIRKIGTLANAVRIEFSDCTGCLECTVNFSCPENAIKTDEERNVNYIDSDLCVKCMECINDFSCPDDAFTTSEDKINPGIIENFEASSNEPGELTISFTTPGDDADTGRAYDFVFSLKNGEEILVNAFPNYPENAGENETHTFNELPEGEIISLSLEVLDEVGNSSGKIEQEILISATELDETAPATITDLHAEAQGEDILLSWTASGDDDLVGTVQGYDVRYSTSAITNDNFTDATEISFDGVPVSAGNEQTFIVSALEINTEYFFAVKAFDEANNYSDISNNDSASIDVDNIAPSAISDLSDQVVTNESITLQWTATGDNEDQGTATSYVLKQSASEITEANWDTATTIENTPTPQEAGNLESFEIIGLSEGTSYYFAIKAIDEVGNISAISNILNVSTQSAADSTSPNTISDFRIVTGTNTNGSSIQLRWTAPGDDNTAGTATRYEIRKSNQAITEANWASATPLPSMPTPAEAGTTESYTVTGVSQAETTYFAIKAFDEVDNVNETSNSPAGRIVYQINESQCRDCNACLWDCDEGAISDAGSYKSIDPDLCIACGDCSCPFGFINIEVVAYGNPRVTEEKSLISKIFNLR